MRLFKLGLIAKIAFVVALVELIVFSLMTFFYVQRYSNHIIEKDLITRSHLVNEMIANSELPISSISSKSFMSSMVGESYLQGVVVGNNGFIIVSSDPQYLGKKLDDVPGFSSKLLLKKAGEEFIFDDERLISTAYLSSDMNTTPLYHTVISLSTQKIAEEKKKILLLGILGSSIFILLSTGAIIIFAQRFLARRIDDSLAVLKSVEQGNLDLQIQITQSDELGLLQKGINSMIQKVAKLLLKYENSMHETQISKQFTREIIDTVPVRIFWKDKNNVYLGANKLFLQDAGLESEDQIIGKTDWDMVWKSNAQAYIDDDSKVMNSGIPKIQFEEPLLTADGSKKYLLTSKVPLVDKDNGRVYGILGVFNDITEQKLAQEEMHKKDALLLEQSKLASMGEMIGNIAHQWRQPLSIITTSASAMDMKADYDDLSKDEIKKLSTGIVDQANYLSNTIDDFRNFIKGDIKHTNISVKKVLKETFALVDATLKNNYITLISDIYEDMEIYGTKNEFSQALINIINNSKDALKETKGERFLFISTKKIDENNLELKIRDNGGGIPENIVKRIFEPYFTTKHQSVGTGLGLSMVHKIIVERYGHEIDIYNEEFEHKGKIYKGACCTIVFHNNKKLQAQIQTK